MTLGGLLRRMATACLVLAAASAVIGFAIGRPGPGIGMAAGILLGSLNGYLIQGLMSRGTPFAASGLFRILFFSSLVLVAAFTLRSSAWAFALGIGIAQLVMVAVSIRQGMRA